MTRDDMIRMAREAGWEYAHGDSGYEPLWRFAALVAAAEREACAKLCDDLDWSQDSTWQVATLDCAAAIRARGQA